MGLYEIIAKFNLKKAIIRMLEDNEDGLNIQMLVRKAGMRGSYGTIKMTKILENLKQKREIKERKIGLSRVFYVDKKVFKDRTERNDDQSVKEIF